MSSNSPAANAAVNSAAAYSEGASGKNCAHAGLDGDFVGPAGFGITNKRDELRRQGVHWQACHRLRADGAVDGASQQRIPEGGVAGGWR